MSVRMWAASGVLLCTVASGVMAQSPGAFEIGGFGQESFFDDTLNLDRQVGGGGWLGFYPVRNIDIEGEVSYLSTKVISFQNKVSNIPIRGRLVYNVPLGENASAFRIGAGYVRDMYRKEQHFNDNGFTALAGFRLGVSENVGLRVSATMDWVPSPQANRADHYINWGMQLGIGILFNNRADADRDGVKDNLDRCPDTPRGEAVDASGCSASQRDTDADGIKDNLDKCPNTPPGEKVDANGCSAAQLDADADGVADGVDKCPNTPKGEQVDASGCSASQRDADGDGVKDGVDKCPDTPKGEQVDANGCSESQRDADGDGVKDSADKCPDTPQGEPVDANGCSRDSDADGVPDGKDKCPSTPNGQAVDENGCPVLFEGEKKSVVLKGVNFDIGKATLTDDSKLVLKDVATSLAARPDVRVEVQGHTDITGSRALNLRLSKARAETVEKFLEENGVSPGQLTAKGYGPDKPIASNKTKAGRAQNRRVELVRLN